MALGLTLLDLMALSRNDTVTGLVEDVTTLAPELDEISAVRRSGIRYEIVRRTQLPTAGFRNVNAGVTGGTSDYKKEWKEMFFLDVPITMDEAVEQGDDKSVGDAWTLEALGAMRAAVITIGAQVFYGRNSDAAGFHGLRAQCAGSVGAGGSTNSTSAYLIWEDPKWGVRFDIGQNGDINMRPPMRQQVVDPNNSAKTLFAWVSNLSCYIALTVISDKAVWAVTGIDGTTNALTDKIAAQLISNIPAARRQNLRWFINRSSEYYLQNSRTAINLSGGYALQPADAGGRPAWSPKPNMLEGYPITLTDSITNTESN